MNKILFKSLLVALALLCLTGCGPKEEEVKLRVLLEDPYETPQEDPAEDSMEMELARRIGSALGMDYELVPLQRGQRAEDVLEAGGADLALGNIVRSKALEQDFICSVSYATRPVFIATVRGDFRNIPRVFREDYIGLSADLSEQARAQIENPRDLILKAYSTAKMASDGLRNGEIAAYFCYEREAFELALEDGIQVQDAVGVDADRFVVIAPKEGLVGKENLDYQILNYLVELEALEAAEAAQAAEQEEGAETN